MTEQELREAKRHMSDKVYKLFVEQVQKTHELENTVNELAQKLETLTDSLMSEANG